MSHAGNVKLIIAAAIAATALLAHTDARAGKASSPGRAVTPTRAGTASQRPVLWAWKLAAKAVHEHGQLHDVRPYGLTREKRGAVQRHVFNVVGSNTIITVDNRITVPGKGPKVTRYRSAQRAWDIRPEAVPNRLRQLGLDLGPSPKPIN